jgi:hypothetical protein
LMPAQRSKRRHSSGLDRRRAAQHAANAVALSDAPSGAAEGQAVRPAFDQHSSCPLGRCHSGPRPIREDTCGQRACPRRRIGNPNLVDRCVEPDASGRLHRPAGEGATAAPIRSDHFGRVRGPDTSARWRCPNTFRSARWSCPCTTEVLRACLIPNHNLPS